MNVLDAISLFRSEVINEIFHSAADEELQTHLVEAIKNCEKLVIETYEAEKRNSPK